MRGGRRAARARPSSPIAEADHCRAVGSTRTTGAGTRRPPSWAALDRPVPRRRSRAGARREALVAAGDREAAAAPASEALGDRPSGSARRGSAGELESLAARARLRLRRRRRAGRGAAPTATEDEDPFGLTPRERQVLALVAAGATNREIGRQLYMAEKTASVHVSRILAKLDVRSRTEAAGVAHRLGLDATV